MRSKQTSELERYERTSELCSVHVLILGCPEPKCADEQSGSLRGIRPGSPIGSDSSTIVPESFPSASEANFENSASVGFADSGSETGFTGASAVSLRSLTPYQRAIRDNLAQLRMKKADN